MQGTSDYDQFIDKTMRHFAQMRRVGHDTGDSAGRLPYPDGWFDLPQQTLADLGAIFYLAALTPFYSGRALAGLLYGFEPPVRLGQYKVLRAGAYPRAVATWAGLSADAEWRFAVDHQPLCPEDWNSGASIWLVDLIAPFGQIDEIARLLAMNTEVAQVRTMWHNRDASRYRIIEWRRATGQGRITVRSYGVGQFRARLAGAG